MSRKIPLCAFCGEPLKGRGQVRLSYSLPGRPEVGWHWGVGENCFECDEENAVFGRRRAEGAGPKASAAVVDALRRVDARAPGRVVAGKAWREALAAGFTDMLEHSPRNGGGRVSARKRVGCRHDREPTIYVVADAASISGVFSSAREARREFVRWRREGGDGRLEVTRWCFDGFAWPGADLGGPNEGTAMGRKRRRGEKRRARGR